MRKTYFIAWDQEILDKLKTEFSKEKEVKFLDGSTTLVQNLKDTDFIVGVTKGDASPMGYHGYHMLYSTKDIKFNDIVKIIRKELYGYKKLEEVIKEIQKGSLKVTFLEFLFGAGHSADVHVFGLWKNGKLVGNIELLDLDGFQLILDNNIIYQNDGSGHFERVNYEERNLIKRIIGEALKGDKEYADICVNEQGAITVPMYNWDISREELLQSDIKEVVYLQPIA